jgi:hypothetical protein
MSTADPEITPPAEAKQGMEVFLYCAYVSLLVTYYLP